MLIIFGGLPGTGKTTIAKALAQKINAVYLRIDTIENVLKKFNPQIDIGPWGYILAYDCAGENLRLGLNVIADSVNLIGITRKDWRRVVIENKVPFLEIEFIWSNSEIHRNCVETRSAE